MCVDDDESQIKMQSTNYGVVGNAEGRMLNRVPRYWRDNHAEIRTVGVLTQSVFHRGPSVV